ncbi:hypothetical protein H8356DRAFT_1353840 [Neocallimastix lanati (nom. inval.)]|nr:hypothetical protein H8356DRAFT_1353840 [Neocallimastix sp. JGI-2020a]
MFNFTKRTVGIIYKNDLVEYLIELCEDINRKNNVEIPFFKVCKSGNTDLDLCFVEHGADANKENKNGEKLLFNLCESENEYLKINEDGKTPSYYAYVSENKELVECETPLFYESNCKN